jgi:copper(I)-binding protein
MRTVGRLGLVLIFLLAFALAACGGSLDPKLKAEDVWSRPSVAMTMAGDSTASGGMGGGTGETVDTQPSTGATGAVFMKLVNEGGQPDKLISAETDVATTAELHKSTVTDGVMQMSPVESIEIPANGSVELKPGDYHIMLLGLKRDLKAGDEFKVKLNFEKSQPMELDVKVREM